MAFRLFPGTGLLGFSGDNPWMPSPPSVRPIHKEDADTLALLAEDFERYLDHLVDGRHKNSRMTKDVFLRDGFGETPSFHGLLLEEDGSPIGYLLYCFGYNTDLASRTVQVIDLYIKSEWLGKGFGRLLMRTLIPICKTAGVHAICTSVWNLNPSAKHFTRV